MAMGSEGVWGVVRSLPLSLSRAYHPLGYSIACDGMHFVVMLVNNDFQTRY